MRTLLIGVAAAGFLAAVASASAEEQSSKGSSATQAPLGSCRARWSGMAAAVTVAPPPGPPRPYGPGAVLPLGARYQTAQGVVRRAQPTRRRAELLSSRARRRDRMSCPGHDVARHRCL